MTSGAPPLAGIRVLDFTRVMAGPYLTMILADLGAEVIKIENPSGGDDTRAYRPPEIGGESAYFLAVNRHKRSVALDMATEEGQAICRALAEKSDILVQNFRADVMERWGLDWERMHTLNPRLIYVSISGYGQTGPYRLVAGYDQIAQGEGGLQYLTGHPGEDPVRAGASLADTLTGLHAGMGLLAALHARTATGLGQHVDLALLDTVVAITSYHAQGALATGEDPPRVGNESNIVVPTGLFPCADGPINLLVGNDRQFGRFCRDVLERPEMADDPRYRTNADRRANAATLNAAIAALLAERPRAWWIERCRANGVPAGSVRTVTEAVAAPEPRERGMIQPVEHPAAGRYETVGSPIKLSETPVRPAGPAPTLGQHGEQALADVLGWDEDRIASLRRAGVLG